MSGDKYVTSNFTVFVIGTLSRATRDGRAYEQLVPYLPEFEERYSRGDARLLGSPIDFVVFDGLYSGEGDIREIVFIEIKSGKPDLTKSERAVKRAVEEGRVRWDPDRSSARKSNLVASSR